MNKTAALDYRKSMQRMSQQLGLGRFLDWWLGELSAMIPRSLSGTSGTMERRVLVEVGDRRIKFSRVVDGKVAEVGHVDMTALNAAEQQMAFQSEFNKISRQKTEISLYLMPEQVLRKKLSLPLAAEENLRQVIAYEMDRHTPFKAEQVYFDYKLVRRDKQLDVLLAVAPRAVIDDPLRQLAAWGIVVSAVQVADDVTDGVPWNLLPAGQRQKGKDTRVLRMNIALASGAAALLCLVLALPVWQKRETVLTLLPLVDKAHQQAAAAEDLRRQVENLLAEYNYLLDKKRELPPVVAVLDDVTRVLPDDTWVQQFDLKGKEMLIQGETASSSKLAGLFEQSKTLHNANFRAPLTKGQGANSERFQLAAETRPLPRAETMPQLQPQAQPAQTGAAVSNEKVARPDEKGAVVEQGQEKDKAAKSGHPAPEAAKEPVKPPVNKVQEIRGEPKPVGMPAVIKSESTTVPEKNKPEKAEQKVPDAAGNSGKPGVVNLPDARQGYRSRETRQMPGSEGRP